MLKTIAAVQENADLLHDESEIDSAIDSMAEQINSELKDTNPVILCVMNGGIVVMGKLLPRLTITCVFDSINASRYGSEISGGKIKWKHKPETDLTNRTVLIVDDILDQGFTLEAIINYCKQQGASSVYSAVLVNKILEYSKPVTADFVALEVENRYLFGYGMDYKGYLRNAAGIYACKEE